jgi:hypothetical protein
MILAFSLPSHFRENRTDKQYMERIEASLLFCRIRGEHSSMISPLRGEARIVGTPITVSFQKFLKRECGMIIS